MAIVSGFPLGPVPVAWCRATFGIVLHLVTFKIFAPAVFTVFEDANQPFELVSRVVFGLGASPPFSSTEVAPTSRAPSRRG